MNNKIDIFAALVFKILPEDGGNIPFYDIIKKPNSFIPKNNEEWEIIWKSITPDGIPFQSYKFSNDVLIRIEPDFAEIRQDVTQGKNVELKNITKIAEAFSDLAIKNNIQHIGLNYAFIMQEEEANERLNTKSNISPTESPMTTGYRLAYLVENNSDETINIDIQAGGATFSPNPEIKGILFQGNYNKSINRMKSVLSFVDEKNLNDTFEKIKEKTLRIADNL
jgi:hypothetical protein